MANKSMGTLGINLVVNTGSFEEGSTRAERALDKLTSSLSRQKSQFQSLVDQIDPVSAAINKLERAQESLGKQYLSGNIDAGKYNQYTNAITNLKNEVYATNSAFSSQLVEFNKVVNQIDPALAKMNSLDAAQQQLKAGFGEGFINEAEFNRLNGMLEQTRAQLNGSAKEAEQFAKALELQKSKLEAVISQVDPLAASLGRLDAMQDQLNQGLSMGLIDDTAYKNYSNVIGNMREEVLVTNSAFGAQQREFSALVSQIDPLTSRMDQVRTMQEKLQTGFKAGLVDEAEFNRLNGILNQTQLELSGVSTKFDKNGLSAKQMQAALRGVPAQFTDIAVSLQAGQNPLTVFLQQGGQLKDMFGGVGPAAKALGGYVLSLINPVTTLAAGVGVLAFAYYKGSIEQDHFRNNLILTGNTAGTTSEQMVQMARNLDAIEGTQRQASAALAEIAKTGKFTGDQMEMVGKAALQMQNTTGKAMADTIAEFAKLAKDPAKNIAELNEKYNFLTADIYEQIAALQDQGREQEASTLAMQAYADAVDQRTNEINQNLGLIESAWKGIKNAASEAWDAILDVGRTDTLKDKLAEIDEQLALAIASQSGGGTLSWMVGSPDQGYIDNLKKQRNELLAQLDLEESKAQMQAEAAKIAADAIKAQQEISKVTEQTKTNEEKRAAAIKDYYNNLDKIREGLAAAGKDESESEFFNPEKIARDIKVIEEKFKDSNKAITNGAAQQMIQRLREQEAALNAQLNQEQKIGEARRELIKFDQKIADLKNKGILTASEKSLLAESEILRAQLEKNAAIEDEITAKAESLRLTSLQQSLMAEISRDAERYQDLLNAFGKGDKQLAKLQDRQKIEREYERDLERLSKRQKELTEESYKAELEMLNQQLAEKLALHEGHYIALAELEGDWTNGAMSAMQNYIDNAKDIAGQTQDIFTSMFSSLEDSVLEFVKTGEFSIRDLMASIAEDVIRMLIRIGIQKAANFAMDKLFGAAAATGYVASVTGQATAMNFMAGLNAFASTAAIPIVGPALAPGAMAAALAISAPLATGAIAAASASLAGMAHDGLDYIPQEGTWLLDKGER
ncbi:MAG: phage tail tape measure protein, partial [Pseudomonadales bacterium 32-42-5]